ARLEFRGTDDGYARLSQAYFRRLPLDHARRILALGCGTGIEVRALRRVARHHTAIVGLDHSPELIKMAQQLTATEGVSHNVTYRIGDAHHSEYEDGHFDIVTLHTLISAAFRAAVSALGGRNSRVTAGCSDLRRSVLGSHTGASISGPVKLLMWTPRLTGAPSVISFAQRLQREMSPRDTAVSSGNREKLVVGASPLTSAICDSAYGRQPE
ncbi:MAG TPA: class I SAM-dependent methyltransferase, partial [Streptosporangiaceae bacterium]|nr:class I SAM-dependent methyltransferase [Streptosporangiaceae bacterium]